MNRKYDLEDYYDDEDYLDDELDYYEEQYNKKQAKPQSNVNKANPQPNKQNKVVEKPKPINNKVTKDKPREENKTKSAVSNKQIESNDSKKDKIKCPFASIEEANSLYKSENNERISNSEFKPTLNLIAIGHVDAGKSTLLGHFLFLLGELSDRQIVKFEKECKNIGKPSFHFAWALDENQEERKRGVTVDIAYKQIQTEKFFINLMDAPGHRDFVPNMISGAAQADAALLIIDASPNSFESGFFLGGQTKEHAILAMALGVKEIIVVINKMEVCDWSVERYEYIEKELMNFLIIIGFNKKDNIHFVPVSGLSGINLITTPEKDKNEWYLKESLLDIINNLRVPSRQYNHPERLLISDISKGIVNNKQGCEIFGMLLGGCLSTKPTYGIYPPGIPVNIKTMKLQNTDVTKSLAYAGNIVELIVDIDENTMEGIK